MDAVAGMHGRPIKCPVCNAEIAYAPSPLAPCKHKRVSDKCSHGCLAVFVSGQQCPVCLEDAVDPPMVVLPCGHVLCREDFKAIGGEMGNDDKVLSALETIISGALREQIYNVKGETENIFRELLPTVANFRDIVFPRLSRSLGNEKITNSELESRVVALLYDVQSLRVHGEYTAALVEDARAIRALVAIVSRRNGGESEWPSVRYRNDHMRFCAAEILGDIASNTGCSNAMRTTVLVALLEVIGNRSTAPCTLRGASHSLERIHLEGYSFDNIPSQKVKPVTRLLRHYSPKTRSMGVAVIGYLIVHGQCRDTEVISECMSALSNLLDQQDFFLGWTLVSLASVFRGYKKAQPRAGALAPFGPGIIRVKSLQRVESLRQNTDRNMSDYASEIVSLYDELSREDAVAYSFGAKRPLDLSGWPVVGPTIGVVAPILGAKRARGA